MSAKNWYESKTILLNSFTFIAALLSFLLGPEYLTGEVLKGVIAGLGAANVVLRFTTRQPVVLP